jgi:uncharacterized protein (DUF302 family)
MNEYGTSITLDVDCEGAVGIVTEALKEQGFGVLTRIDVDKTLKAKLGIDRAPYVILGACNPRLANQALQVEPHVGLLLPCNVIVYEKEGGAGSVVSILDPVQAMGVSRNSELGPVAAEAGELLKAAAAAIDESR